MTCDFIGYEQLSIFGGFLIVFLMILGLDRIRLFFMEGDYG